MSFFPKRSHYIGIDVELSTLKIASLKRGRRSFEILGLKKIPIDTPLPPSLKVGTICSSVCAKEVLIRPIETPLIKDRDIFASLEFQAESYIPYPTSQAVIQGQIIEKKSASTSLIIAAIRKDHLQNHFNVLRKQSIEPDVVTSAHLALAALSAILPHHASMNLYIHIGEKVVTCSLVQKGKLIRGYAFDLCAQLKNEIQKTVLAMNASLKNSTFESIFLFGNATLETLNLIAEVTQKNVHFPFSSHLAISQDDLMNYAIALGSALVGAQVSPPNFRQKEFSYPHPFKRIKKPLCIFMAATALLTLSLFSLGKLATSNQKALIANRYQVLLVQEGKPIKELNSKASYHRELSVLEKEIAQKPDTFALHPVVPKVSEVIGWVASFPVSIEIDSIQYTMVKRPSFNQKNERYQVKLFLEFSAENSIDARSFHEILLAPNAFVDTKQEVQWAMNRDGKYRASFYLKDKTRYLQ